MLAGAASSRTHAAGALRCSAAARPGRRALPPSPSHATAWRPCRFALQVKAFKPTVAKLFEPLAAALLATPAACAAAAEPGAGVEEDREARLLAALLEVYEWPDRHPGEPL